MTVRMRHTKSHTANRRAHHALSKPTVSVDSKTGSIHLRHRASPITGAYKGRTVIDIASKVLKKQQKKADKQKQAR